MNAADVALRREYDEPVREVTAADVNQRLDADALARVERVAWEQCETVEDRLGELNREWDMERVLEVNAASLALTGVALGAMVDRRFLAIPGVVLPFLIQHAVMGWCPPVPLFRRLGVRTKQEIDREIVALKAMRGDFEGVRHQPSSEQPGQVARAAWEAARL